MGRPPAGALKTASLAFLLDKIGIMSYYEHYVCDDETALDFFKKTANELKASH